MNVLRMPSKPTLKQRANITRLEPGTYTMSHLVIWAMLGGLLGLIVGVVVGVAQ